MIQELQPLIYFNNRFFLQHYEVVFLQYFV